MFWIIFLTLLSPSSISAIGQPHYECGEHGRFEYCIDGIPGCIVGCHCHPGYYFDTESKICEPNAKLVHEYRRLYSGSVPTRVPDYLEHELFSSSTTVNPADAKAEINAKESDDLGDWLYNQFFKTIENQIVNNTDPKGSENSLTRRSGDFSDQNGLKQKFRIGKKKILGKKEKKKKNDLRRKLLRITEDDSLFDSSSASSEGSSDSGSESEDSGSETSSDHDDKEHGHRKILMVNKKPKVPLPPFVFLPNMGTPFFPPIALPPPPMPMYPMVPVPPMPYFPFPPGTTEASNSTTSTTTTTPTTSTTATATTSTEAPPSLLHANKPAEGASAPSKTIETAPSSSEAQKLINKEGSLPPGLRSGKRLSGHRKKFLKQLQERMMGKSPQYSKKKKKKVRAEMMDLPPDYDVPFEDDESPMIQPLSRSATMDDLTPVRDVDFKYLTQLIHKMDNRTANSRETPPTPTDSPVRRSGHLVNHFYPPPTQVQNPYQIGNQVNPNQRYLASPDETYYSKLGQEIAALIRKMDVTGEKRLNIEVERNATPQQTFFNENSYAPRSYWERSVRSLINRFQPEDYYPLRNYEENLFNLESKVETAASTPHSLSLNEIENVIFLMDKAKNQQQISTRQDMYQISSSTTPLITKASEDTLNVNLLPRQYERPQSPKFDSLRGPIANMLAELVRNYSKSVRNNRKSYDAPNNRNRGYDTNIRNAPNNVEITPGKSNQRIPEIKNIERNNPNFKNKNYMKAEFQHMEPNVQEIKHINIKIPEFKDLHIRIPDFNKLDIKIPDLKNIPDLPWKHMENYTQNYKNENIANLQRIVGTKLNEVRNSRNQLPNISWLAPNFATMLDNRDTQREAHIHSPVNIKFQVAPRRRIFQNAARYHFDNGNQFRHQRTFLKPAPTYVHHELSHLDFFGK